MANNYSYSFDYTSGVFRPSYVSAIGSFSVDYSSMRVYDVNVVSGDIRFTSGTVEYGKNFDGSSSYRVKLQYSSGTVSNQYASFAKDSANLDFKYESAVTSLFSNVSYLRNIYGSDRYFLPVRTSAEATDAPVTTVAVCFTSGTSIRTDRGDVAVEHLRVGDRVMTVTGATRPVAWIGHRRLDAQGRVVPHDQQPIRVRAGAFGPGLPARNLSLSPGHPVLVGADADGAGGHLVPIMCLINGTTIAREPVSSVTYWHIELDAHDILFAEGLPAESYLDWGDRPFFTEASDHALHNPDFVVPGLAARCRPVAVGGPVVEAERRRLSDVFAAALGAGCAWDEAGRFGWIAA